MTPLPLLCMVAYRIVSCKACTDWGLMYS